MAAIPKLRYNTLMAKIDAPAGGTPSNQQPGQVIAPGQTAEPASTGGPTPPPKPAEPTEPAEQPAAPPKPTPAAADGSVSWTASEFVAHEKSTGWYAALTLVAIIITAVVFLITRDKISSGVVLVCALALAVLAARKPRQQQYTVDSGGITVGQKHFDYGMFKSFAVVPEGAFSSIVLTPLKRFAPLTTIYYAPEDEEQIVALLTDHLPFEEHKLDMVDNLMRRIRF